MRPAGCGRSISVGPTAALRTGTWAANTASTSVHGGLWVDPATRRLGTQRRRYPPDVQLADVTAALDALEAAGVRYWVGGGWGVAILAGAQTRAHRDLDLAVDLDDMGDCISALADLGYTMETDWLPVRAELSAGGERWVDLHPLTFGVAGRGRQEGLDGTHFDYPPSAFASGTLEARAIPCLSVQQQREFHSGYPHRPQDIHDLAQLDAIGQR
jgi:lincosamide nucleotidyltransferase A/C/D/E